MDEPNCRERAEQLGKEEEELGRLYDERLCDWSDPGNIQLIRDGKLVEPPIKPDRTDSRKRLFKLPWATPPR